MSTQYVFVLIMFYMHVCSWVDKKEGLNLRYEKYLYVSSKEL